MLAYAPHGVINQVQQAVSRCTTYAVTPGISRTLVVECVHDTDLFSRVAYHEVTSPMLSHFEPWLRPPQALVVQLIAGSHIPPSRGQTLSDISIWTSPRLSRGDLVVELTMVSRQRAPNSASSPLWSRLAIAR